MDQKNAKDLMESGTGGPAFHTVLKEAVAAAASAEATTAVPSADETSELGEHEVKTDVKAGYYSGITMSGGRGGIRVPEANP